MAEQRDVQRVGGPGDWPAYFDAVAGLPARETLLYALGRFEGESGNAAEGEQRNAERSTALGSERLAVDLGCGDGRDAVVMLERGWRVVAVDGEAEGIRRLEARVPVEARARLRTIVARFEDAQWPECDLVNASFSIPHCSPADFPGLWTKIARSIRRGGRFAGQLFGVNDSWAKRPDGVMRTYHTRAEVDAMLAGFEVEMLDEVEREGKTAFGEPKYWHVFHVVARKKS
jgi:SAM-dependent methyltransferase